MESKILRDIHQQDGVAVSSIAEKHGNTEMIPDEKDSPRLKHMCHILLGSLAVTGKVVFDDGAQWHSYQDILAALYLADQELNGGVSELLEVHSIARTARGDYNPLGELDELEEPTIGQLADRYHADEVIDDTWETNPALNLQEHLGAALLELGQVRVPTGENVEQNLLAAMLCVDEHYGTKTTLSTSMETVTESYPEMGINEEEYEVRVMNFKQHQQSAPNQSNA